MEHYNVSSTYGSHHTQNSYSNTTPFAAETDIPSSHCPKCFHSSTLIAALWQRISALEGQIFQVSAEKAGAENVVRSLLHLQTNFLGTRPQTSSQGSHSSETTNHQPTGINQSFDSCDTLIQTSPIPDQSASESSKAKDPPLIDFFDSCETESTIHILNDGLNESKTELQATDPSKDLSEQHYDYIHHFKYQENLATSPQLPIKSTSQSQSGSIAPFNRSYMVRRLPCTSSGKPDSEESSDQSDYASANTSFSECFEGERAPRAKNLGCQMYNVSIQKAADVSPESFKSSKPCFNGLERSVRAADFDDVDPEQSDHALAKSLVANVGDLWTESRLTGSRDEYGTSERNFKSPRRFARLAEYGVQYDPNPTARNLYRTVVVSGLRSSCTIAQVLEQVRGGLVVEIVLLNTIKITGTKSALISFFEEHSAMAYGEYVKNHVVKLDGQIITTSVVPTPSWPLTLALKRAISERHHTRCLEVHGFPREISPSTLRKNLEVDSAVKSDTLVHMTMKDDDVLKLHFSSVMAAQQAFDNLSLRLKHRHCPINYVKDPCDQPLDNAAIDLGKVTLLSSNV